MPWAPTATRQCSSGRSSQRPVRLLWREGGSERFLQGRKIVSHPDISRRRPRWRKSVSNDFVLAISRMRKSPTWKTKNIATAACRALSLSDGTKLATRAASTISVAIHPRTPKAMYLFRGNKSTRKMAIAFRPSANVSHAAGYRSCLT